MFVEPKRSAVVDEEIQPRDGILSKRLQMSDWWRNHADPTMRALFYSKGPFKGCTLTAHALASKPLPVAPAPEGLFSNP